jgi:hypothetical protein
MSADSTGGVGEYYDDEMDNSGGFSDDNSYTTYHDKFVMNGSQSDEDESPPSHVARPHVSQPPRGHPTASFSSNERRKCFDVIQTEMTRRSGGSTLSSLEDWFTANHDVLMKKVLGKHDSLQRFLESFPRWLVLTTSRSGKNVFVRFPNSGRKKGKTVASKPPVVKGKAVAAKPARPPISQISKGIGKSGGVAKQLTELELIESVENIVRNNGGLCLVSLVGSRIKDMGITIQPVFSSLKDLLDKGFKLERFILHGSGGTTTVSLAVKASAKRVNTPQISSKTKMESAKPQVVQKDTCIVRCSTC